MVFHGVKRFRDMVLNNILQFYVFDAFIIKLWMRKMTIKMETRKSYLVTNCFAKLTLLVNMNIVSIKS